jgi:hypothetical protein
METPTVVCRHFSSHPKQVAQTLAAAEQVSQTLATAEPVKLLPTTKDTGP